MARIVGIDIPNDKKIKIALTYIYGIGPQITKKILASTRVDGEKRVHELSEEELNRMRTFIEENCQVEGALRQEITTNIRRLKTVKAYRGVRHLLGLPVRGQRTRSNAHTRKGRAQAVGGLKIKLAKK